MNSLTEAQLAYWQQYLSTLPAAQRPTSPCVSAGYAGTPEMTDDLLELYLSGRKTAGSSVIEDFLSAGDPVPCVGNYWIYLSSAGLPCCILQTEKTVTHKFKDVPAEIALAEGEGDLSLHYWRKVHSELYSPHLSEWGISHIDNATIVTEYFKIVYKKNS